MLMTTEEFLIHVIFKTDQFGSYMHTDVYGYLSLNLWLQGSMSSLKLASLKIEQIFIATLTVIHLQNSHIHIIELLL